MYIIFLLLTSHKTAVILIPVKFVQNHEVSIMFNRTEPVTYILQIINVLT